MAVTELQDNDSDTEANHIIQNQRERERERNLVPIIRVLLTLM